VIPLRRILAEKRRIVIPLLIALAANLVLYAAAVYPLSRKVGSAEERAATARAAREAAEREHTAARATLEGKDRADRELQKFYAEILPSDQAAARRITYLRLDRLSREAGLEPGRTRFDPRKVRDSSLTELDTTVELQGDYRAIRRFVYLLETAPEFTIIQNVELSSSEEGPLQLTLSLVTYYRTSGSNGD
jgi:Tfp pilus assembly protein PilO